MNKLTFFLIITFSLFLSSCASNSFNVNVSSIARSDSIQKQSYILVPGNEKIEASDLQFQEYANYVERGLVTKGFTRAEKQEEADLIIYLSYGIGEPTVYTSSYSVPTWGQTGYSGSTTTGSVNSYSNNYATYSANTTYTPTYGVTGYVPVTKNYVLYSRWLMLTAYDLQTFKNNKKMEQVWKTSAVSSGENSNLRQVLPALVVGSWRFWGMNSRDVVSFNIDENDPAIIELRRPTINIRDIANVK